MANRNVLVLTPWYPTRGHRYAGVFVREYAKAVQDRWNPVVLHAGTMDETLPQWWAVQRETNHDLTDGVPSYRASYRHTQVRGCNRLRYWCSMLQSVRTIGNEHGRPDIIHAHVYSMGAIALLLGRLYGVPVVISEHSSAFARGLLPPRELAKAKRVMGKANAVLPVSHSLQDTLERLGIVASFQVVPNVIDTDHFFYLPSDPQRRGVARLLAVSSLIALKGLRFLFRALAESSCLARAWHLDVVGDGPEATAHQQMVDELGLGARVSLHGQMQKKDVAVMMKQADLFVLPSLVETFSVATAEALASGLPVLVTKCGGPEEFVTERSGVIVPPGDVTGLANGLIAMLDRLPAFDPAAIAKEARDRFGRRVVGTMLDVLYSRLLGTYTN